MSRGSEFALACLGIAVLGASDEVLANRGRDEEERSRGSGFEPDVDGAFELEVDAAFELEVGEVPLVGVVAVLEYGEGLVDAEGVEVAETAPGCRGNVSAMRWLSGVVGETLRLLLLAFASNAAVCRCGVAVTRAPARTSLTRPTCI